MTGDKKILSIAIVVGITTYLFWKPILNTLHIPVYYIGNALFIFLLAVYIKRVTPKSFITFFLVCITLSNLIDELFFDNTKFGINEIIATIFLPMYYYLNERVKQ
jgi:uncharacterized membrane protein YvlD (DUF360 family)